MTSNNSDISFEKNSNNLNSFLVTTTPNAPKISRNKEVSFIPPRTYSRIDNGFVLVQKYQKNIFLFLIFLVLLCNLLQQFKLLL